MVNTSNQIIFIYALFISNNIDIYTLHVNVPPLCPKWRCTVFSILLHLLFGMIHTQVSTKYQQAFCPTWKHVPHWHTPTPTSTPTHPHFDRGLDQGLDYGPNSSACISLSWYGPNSVGMHFTILAFAKCLYVLVCNHKCYTVLALLYLSCSKLYTL